MREWAIQNAELWVRDYRIDGLRLDAVHAVQDDSPLHVLAELAERVREVAPRALVISEMGPDDFRPLREWGHDAMWLDSLHHALHVALTGERDGYYAPFDGSIAEIARELGRPEGPRLVACAQNHDQVGNRAVGDRLAPERLRVAQAVVLFSPFTPLLFQGEEYARVAPVPVLHGPHRPVHRRGDARRPPARVRRVRGLLGRGRPGSSGARDLRALEARPAAARIRSSRGCCGCAAELPRELDVSLDEGARRLELRRGRARLTVDFRSLEVELRRVRPWPGSPYPLGPQWDGDGTNFSLFSEHATKVELCLFDEDDRERRHELHERTAFNWHGYFPGIGPGQRYGYRVYGRWAPEQGHRFNPAKLLIDPYAKAIEGPIRWEQGNTLPYVPGDEDADLERDDEDDAAAIPKSIVVDHSFDWEDVRQPRTPWHETVIYETHVRGFTKQMPGVRDDLRGTYAGLASETAIGYLTDLGITAVELLPIHHIADEQALAAKGLTNYWGYSSIGYLAPHAGYSATGSTGDQVREFKGMVKALHRAGIEVILDVVYNHTAEGNHLGPMLSFKGIDNLSYYRTVPESPRFYMDYTGTGNSLNPVHPSVLRLIMDSLRYFVIECHVDGFRFDLASALARELHEVDRLSAFFDIIHQDPVLSQVKLIAEPWDVGEGGYQVGNFPVLWTEWNGIYRDTMRDFWRGEAVVGDFASRFTGSSDLYEHDGRKPFASINFITAHDGFTLRDLVSYNEKHNEANLEGNRDGDNHNRSWNHGVEGETDDPAINELRERQMRNFLATLFLSQGVPMLLAGDEFARTQHGNNNAYCQDNELSWLDWNLDERQVRQHAFTKRLLEFRRRHAVFRRADFLTGEERLGSGSPDVWWFRTDGRKMTQQNWRRGDTHTLGVLLNGAEIPTVTAQGAPVIDDTFLILFNADPEAIVFTLPAVSFGRRWVSELSTAEPDAEPGAVVYPARGVVPVEGRSLAILRRIA